MTTAERRHAVLQAIVEEYVNTHEPVGSKAIAERRGLGVSSATIRNDMAVLEEAGLIAQPHTSAGRVPTNRGYRQFVDSLHDIKPLSRAERAAIERWLTGAVDLDDVLQRSVRLLSEITHNVAVVQYPSLSRTAVRHIELVPLSDRHLLTILITDGGRVEQRTIEVQVPDPVAITHIRDRLNQLLTGLLLTEVTSIELDENEPYRELAQCVLSAVIDTLRAEQEERVVLAGTAHLARHTTDFAHSISPVLDALEENVVLLRLLSQVGDGVAVRIGSENPHEAFHETSVVSSGYRADNQIVAQVGVVGPTRMNYPNTIAAVHAVAAYLSEILRS